MGGPQHVDTTRGVPVLRLRQSAESLISRFERTELRERRSNEQNGSSPVVLTDHCVSSSHRRLTGTFPFNSRSRADYASFCFCSDAEFARLQRLSEGAPSGYELFRVGPSSDHDTGWLSALCRKTNIDTVTLGAAQLADAGNLSEIAQLLSDDVRVRSVGQLIEEVAEKVDIDGMESSVILELGRRPNAFYRFFRAALDLVGAVIGLALLAPLFLAVAVSIRLDSPGPIVYRQIRVGRNGRPFALLKFRTMVSDAESNGARFASPDDDRVTRVGRFLRRSRLDELPQLVNILRGQMSLIGPRPERPEFVQEYRRELPSYDFRHLAKPGVTGWAQVTEGYTDDVLGTSRKLQRDLYYLKHRSFVLDMKVLSRTVTTVLSGKGR